MRGSRAVIPTRAKRCAEAAPNGTSAEDTLWFQLRDRRLGGFKFIRQSQVEQFFVDFACREQRLIAGIDGGTHGTPDQIASDGERDQRSQDLGYKIVRIQNLDGIENIDGVLAAVLYELERRNC